MRTTITLILMMFCLVGRGQGLDSTYVKHNSLIPRDTIYPNIDSITGEVELPIIEFPMSGNYHQPTPIEQLLSHWKAYKQECWNDSTAYRGHISNKNPYTLEIVDYSIVWMHKEPTLEGFMDYLERKR